MPPATGAVHAGAVPRPLPAMPGPRTPVSLATVGEVRLPVMVIVSMIDPMARRRVSVSLVPGPTFSGRRSVANPGSETSMT